MSIEEIRNHCLEKDPSYLNLKCDPERAIELREQYEAIRPGYRMN